MHPFVTLHSLGQTFEELFQTGNFGMFMFHSNRKKRKGRKLIGFSGDQFTGPSIKIRICNGTAAVGQHSRVEDRLGESAISRGSDIVVVGPRLHARRFFFGVVLCMTQYEGSISEHFGAFRSTMSQGHGYNTRNDYMPKVSRSRTEWGRNKTYYKSIDDWASLPSTLKKLMPETLFKHKPKQFLLNHFLTLVVF